MQTEYIETLCGVGAVNDNILAKTIADFGNQTKVKGHGNGEFTRTNQINVVHHYTPIVERLLGRKVQYTNGNYYHHTDPYLPHTDWIDHADNTINVVIPLKFQNEQPHLVIFDQIWPANCVCWMMHIEPVIFLGQTYTGIKGWPSEYQIEGKTGKPIDDDFYENYLKGYQKHMLKDLSGSAYPFSPGNMIIFDSRRIHATAITEIDKLGLTLRYKLIG